MAQFILNVADGEAARTRKALCAYIGLTTPEGISHANAKEALKQFVRNQIAAYEQAKAEEAARATVTAPPEIT